MNEMKFSSRSKFSCPLDLIGWLEYYYRRKKKLQRKYEAHSAHITGEEKNISKCGERQVKLLSGERAQEICAFQ